MKNNLKISLIALSTLLTACGGGGSGNSVPNTTLPGTTISSFSIQSDNKKEIVEMAEESLGKSIDTSNYDTIVAVDDSLKTSTTNVANTRNAVSKSAKTTSLSEIEKKYNLIQIYAKWIEAEKEVLETINEKLKNKDIFTTAITQGLTIFVGKEVAETISKAENIIDAVIEKVEDIKTAIEENKAKFEVVKYDLSKDFKFPSNIEQEDSVIQITVDENGNAKGIKIDANGINVKDLEFELSDLRKYENGLLKGEKTKGAHTYELTLGGDSMELSYSQFGMMKDNFVNDYRNNESATVFFFGGNEKKKIDMTNLAGNFTFEGRALGNIVGSTYELDGNNTPKKEELVYKDLDGTVSLNVIPENNTEIATFKFDDWYDITVKKEGSEISSKYSLDGKNFDSYTREYFIKENEMGEMTAVEPNNPEYLITEYYGADKNPSEAVGRYSTGFSGLYTDKQGNQYKDAVYWDIVFGAKRAN